MSETAYQSRVDIRGLFIPLGNINLLLPNAAVVEIVTARELEETEGEQPAWLLGHHPWRNRSVAVVSFQRLVGLEDAGGSAARRRLAVCHTFSSRTDLPFVAIETQGLPQLVNMNEESLEALALDEATADWPVLDKVMVHEDQAYVPDLEAIGRLLEGLA